MKRFAGFTVFELIVVVVLIGILISILLPAVQSSREMARRISCSNNLMQLGLAARNFEQSHGSLPPGTIGDTGPIRNVPIGKHLGWLAHLLPYLEQDILFEKINFSHGIYTPENRAAWLAPMPNVLRCPSDGSSWSYGHGAELLDKPGQTNYVACHGGTETPIDVQNDGVFFLNSKIRNQDIPDGAAHTIFFGETSILNERHFNSKKTRYYHLIFPASETDHSDENTQELLEEETEPDPFEMAGYYGEKYVYGSLGWLSGSPGTIRNSALSPNHYRGPFSNWPMPQEYLSGTLDQCLSSDLRSEDESNDPAAEDDVEEAPSLEESPTVNQENQGYGSYSSRDESNDPTIDDDLWDEDVGETIRKQQLLRKLPESIWQREVPEQWIVGSFGSNHANVANISFGDGSVRPISTQIDAAVFQALGKRNSQANQSAVQ